MVAAQLPIISHDFWEFACIVHSVDTLLFLTGLQTRLETSFNDFIVWNLAMKFSLLLGTGIEWLICMVNLKLKIAKLMT